MHQYFRKSPDQPTSPVFYAENNQHIQKLNKLQAFPQGCPGRFHNKACSFRPQIKLDNQKPSDISVTQGQHPVNLHIELYPRLTFLPVHVCAFDTQFFNWKIQSLQSTE